MTRKVRTFTTIQRFYHKHLIYLIFFFILTGLPLLSDAFHWVAYVFSFPFNFIAENNGDLLATGLQVSRAIHRISALLLVLITIPFALAMLVNIRRWQVWPDRWGVGATVEGFKALKSNYIDYGHTRFGKYNMGQKAAFWLFLVGMVLITASGFVLWFRSFFSQAMLDASRIVHDVAFMVVVLTLLVHIYFALFPRNKYGMEAMFRTGVIDEDIVREHHGDWYDKIKHDSDAFESQK